MFARKAVPFVASLWVLLSACSSGTGTGDEPGADRPDEEEEGGSSGKGGKSGAGGKAGAATKGGSGGAISAGGKAGNGSGGTDEGGAGGSSGSSAGTGGKAGASGSSAGGGGKASTGGSGGAAGKSGAGGTGGVSGAAGKSGGAGTNAGGTNAGGTSAGGTSAGGTSAGGASAGGTNAGGTNAGGSSAGGTAGAPTCIPSAATEVCYNGKDDDCDGSQDEECPPLTLEGNWRWTFTFDDAQRRTALALVGSTNVVGNAIDEYGFATWSGTFTPATKAFSLTKKYDDGDTFLYTGTATFTPAGVTVAGKWKQDGGSTETAFDGVLQTTRPVSNAAGAWKIDAYFDPAVTANLAVTAQGYVTGTMSDNVGASTLAGIFDRGDGQLFVKKDYGSGGTRWWKGNVSANGQTITGGTIGFESNALDDGGWTGQR